MRKAAAVILAALVAFAALVSGASAATPQGPEVFSFGAKRGEYFGQHAGQVRLHFYGTYKAIPFDVAPLQRDGRSIGTKAIAELAKSGSELTVELHNGRPEADSIVVRVADVRADDGQLIVTGKRVGAGRARSTLANPDDRLPKVMRGALLTLDVNPSGPMVEGPDGRRFENASIGLVKVPGAGSAHSGPAAGALARPSNLPLSRFDTGSGQAESGFTQVILWQWVEQTSFECSMYETEANPMTVDVESTLEGRRLRVENTLVTPGTKPLEFSGPTNESVIQVDEKTPTGYAAHFKVSTKFPTSVFSQFQLWPEEGKGNFQGATMAIACVGNAEGHEEPPAPEPEPRQEGYGWAHLGGGLFVPEL